MNTPQLPHPSELPREVRERYENSKLYERIEALEDFWFAHGGANFEYETNMYSFWANELLLQQSTLTKQVEEAVRAERARVEIEIRKYIALNQQTRAFTSSMVERHQCEQNIELLDKVLDNCLDSLTTPTGTC